MYTFDTGSVAKCSASSFRLHALKVNSMKERRGKIDMDINQRV